jgi:hypothetical protein
MQFNLSLVTYSRCTSTPRCPGISCTANGKQKAFKYSAVTDLPCHQRTIALRKYSTQQILWETQNVYANEQQGRSKAPSITPNKYQHLSNSYILTLD